MQEIVDVLKQAKEDYYNNGESNLTDKEFDDLENELKELDPTNEYFKMVGIDTYGNKIKHNFPMKSIDKVNSFKELNDWINKRFGNNEINVLITPKYDGLSFTAKYENGKIKYLATRGDGTEGQDISHILKYLDSLNIDLSDQLYGLNFEIRGELIIKKEHQEYFKNKPLRNIVVGLCGRKENNKDCKYITPVIYDVVGLEFDSEDDKFNWLLCYFNEDFTTYKFYDYKKIENFIYKFENEFRDKMKFELDGLVITLNDSNDRKEWIGNHDHHWDYNVAYKFKAISKQTIYRGVKYDVSRYGNLIPVAFFDEVIILNRKINNASLSNYQKIFDMQLKVGDEILVALANDVIPYIEENLSAGIKQRELKNKKEILPLTEALIFSQVNLRNCPSCGKELIVDDIHLKCINQNCPAQNIKIITNYCKVLGMENLSEQTIASLYVNNIIKNINDLYELKNKYEELIGLIGMGGKKINNLLNEVERTKTMTIETFIDSLSISLVGEKQVKKLGIKCFKDFINFSDETYEAGKQIINYVKNNKLFLNELYCHINIFTPTIINKNGRKICMTGKGPDTRENLIKVIEKKGDMFIDGITKETQVLLCEDKNGSSSKLVKARKLGIEIINYSEYF